MTIRILITIFLFSYIAYSQNYGSLRFTNYADDKKGAFSLTFDDGLLTHTQNVAPILNQYGFKGTFYLIPPYLTETLPGIWRYGTWPDFISLANDDHEIGSHTMRHYDLTTLEWGSIDDDSTLLYELYQSQLFIEQRISDKKCISLNYPYTYHNNLVDSAASLFYENARTLGQVGNDSTISGNDWFGLKAKIVEFAEPRNSVDDDLDELYTFLNWEQNAINNHQWGMIIIHDVIPFSELDSLNGQIYQPLTNEWLIWLCEWLWVKSNNKEVWVETVGNIMRYIKERDDAEYQIISSSDQKIELNVTDNLDNEIYNYPLSAYVKIPVSWNFVTSSQGGVIDTLTTLMTDSGRVVLVKVIPDNGIIKLNPVTATNVEDEYVIVSQFQLYQNYPNPFNPSTSIQYSIVDRHFVTLKIFDALGNEIATLVDEEKSAGSYEVEFKGHSDEGQNLSSGVYFYQLIISGPETSSGQSFIQTKKMIYLK